MPAASEDSWEYWNAMQAIRAEGAALAVDVHSALRTCSTKISGDGISYYDLCAIPWLGITSGDARAGVTAAFPKAFYNWTQRYLRAALAHKPPATTSSGMARVFWALDVWAHIQYGLFALNIPFGEPTIRFGRQKRTYPASTPVNGSLPPIAGYNTNIAEYRDATKWLKDKPTNGIRFGAFQENVIGWCDTPYGAKSASRVWSMLLTSMLPWTRDWASHWLQSKGGKDNAELSGSDEVYTYALLQWRLWSVQDWDNFKRSASMNADWPLGMGGRYNCATLTQYTKYISYVEKWTPEIVVQNGYAYPNFAWCFANDLPAQIGAFTTSDYDQVLRKWWQFWVDLEGPHFGTDGQLDMNQTQPVTQTDYGDIDKGMSDAAILRAQAAEKDPRLACEKGDEACLKAAQVGLKVRAIFDKSPLAGLDRTLRAGLAFATKVFGIGMATSGQIPFFVLGPPFSRTYEVTGYSTAPDGSSIDVFMKIATALVAIKNLTGIDVMAAPAQGSTVRATPRDPTCHVVTTPNDGMVEVCASTAAAPAVSAPRAPLDIDKQCERAFGTWIMQNAARVKGMSKEQLALLQSRHGELCHAIATGQLSPLAADTEWVTFVDAQVKRGSLWSAFIHGFIGAGNPLGS